MLEVILDQRLFSDGDRVGKLWTSRGIGKLEWGIDSLLRTTAETSVASVHCGEIWMISQGNLRKISNILSGWCKDSMSHGSKCDVWAECHASPIRFWSWECNSQTLNQGISGLIHQNDQPWLGNQKNLVVYPAQNRVAHGSPYGSPPTASEVGTQAWSQTGVRRGSEQGQALMKRLRCWWFQNCSSQKKRRQAHQIKMLTHFLSIKSPNLNHLRSSSRITKPGWEFAWWTWPQLACNAWTKSVRVILIDFSGKFSASHSQQPRMVERRFTVTLTWKWMADGIGCDATDAIYAKLWQRCRIWPSNVRDVDHCEIWISMLTIATLKSRSDGGLNTRLWQVSWRIPVSPWRSRRQQRHGRRCKWGTPALGKS